LGQRQSASQDFGTTPLCNLYFEQKHNPPDLTGATLHPDWLIASVPMAKTLTVAICLVGMLLACSAIEDFTSYSPGRKLQQALTCNQLERVLLRSNSCRALQNCIAQVAPELNTFYYIAIFQSTCSDCVNSLQRGQCRGRSAPNSCAQGFRVEAILYCLRWLGGYGRKHF